MYFSYNTTGSEDAIATALAVYPYALRLVNAVAVSDTPLVFDRVRWRAVLLNYVIDGKHVIEANDPKQLKKLDEIVKHPRGLYWTQFQFSGKQQSASQPAAQPSDHNR